MSRPAVAGWRADRPWAEKAIVCDGLLPWVKSLLPPGAALATQLRRFHAAGVDHISLTAAVGTDDAATARETLGWLNGQLADQRDWVSPAHDGRTIEQAKANGHLSISFHFQTATPFEEGLDLVEDFHAAGVRRAILAYNTSNIFADGCHNPRNLGLSRAGRDLVRKMDDVGMIIDLSHCGERTTFDVLGLPLSRPPVFSHSNARALFDHERNITDDQISAIARIDGYIGVNGIGFMLGAVGDRIPEMMAEHIAHIAALAGVERVGLGLDFMFLEGSDYSFFRRNRAAWPKGYPEPPWSILQPEQLDGLVQALERRGFAEREIVGILGANYLRRVAR